MTNPDPVPPDKGISPEPQVPPPESPEPSLLHSVFFASEGLRAGWRLLLFVLITVALAFFLGFIVQPPEVHGAARLWVEVAQEGVLVFAIFCATYVMSRIEKRSFGDYGLPWRQMFGKLFWVGAIWGLLAITLLLLGIRGLHGLSFGHLALHSLRRILQFAAFWGLFFLLVAFLEEFLLRGYALFTLTQAIGFWPAAAILSIGFGAMHVSNPGESWIGLIGAGLIGFFFCFSLRRTGSLWFAVGFHQAFDWGETFLYSVPDSGTMEPGHLLNSSFHGPTWLTGGSVGPEASILVFLMVAALWLTLHRVYPQVKYVISNPRKDSEAPRSVLTPETPFSWHQ